MSLSELFWSELTSQVVNDPWGELIGLTISSGELGLDNRLMITLRRADALKKALKVLNGLGIDHEFMVMREGGLRRRQFYTLVALLNEEQAQVLVDRKSHDKIRWSWIKGLMLGRGYFGEPRPWYHVTMDMEITEDASRIKEWLQRRVGRVYLVVRENTSTLHIRSFSAVYALLHGLDTPKTAEELYANHYLRMKKVSAQRLANCDTANLKRQVSKYEFHKHLYHSASLDKLTDEELQLLRMRVKHPEYSYGDLAMELNLTKSKVARLLKNIEAKLRHGVAQPEA